MFGLSTVDLCILFGYSALMLVIGFVAMRRIKNQEDFFLGGRRFGKVLQIFSAFGQATSSDSAVGSVTTTFRDGAGGLWSQLTVLWTTPLYWFTAPWYRRLRVLTLGDFFRERYRSPRMAMLYSSVASGYLVLLIGLGLKALSVTVLGITLKPESAFTPAEHAEHAEAIQLERLTRATADSALSPAEAAQLETLRHRQPRREFSLIDETTLVWFIVIAVFIYGVAGGLEAAVWIDTLQGAMILALSIILVPFAVAKLNALHGVSGLWAAGETLHRELPGYFFAPLGSAQAVQFTWYFVAILCLMSTLNTAVQANQLTANASARDELTASIGFTTGVLIKRYCTIAWGLTGLLCAALYGREIRNSDLVWGHATRDLLGGVGFGLVGVMIACLLAALQSTASTLMISSASLFTRNVYEPLRPGRSEAHYLLAGRITGAFVLVGAALACTAFDTILGMLKFLWEFNVIVAASFWCGLKWRRATRAGAWASMLVALLMFVVLPLGLPAVFPGLRTNAATLRQTQERVIHRGYAASPRDVAERADEIAHWRGPATVPATLRVGELVNRPIVQSPQPICWGQGIEMAGDTPRGSGMFNLEMFLLDRAFDLSGNPYALNETIRYAYKILLPFLVLIGVSWLTPCDDSEPVRRFFLKMRTEVRRDHDEDARALEAAYAHPEPTAAMLLFPRSQLEFFKWSRQDAVGFGVVCLATLGVVGSLWLIVSFGAP